MKYTELDWDAYARKDHFTYFQSMANPYLGTTVEVDISDLYSLCKEKAYPFFLSFLYCIGRAANKVPELRQRILDGKPVEFVSCDTSHTVMRSDGTYGYCRLNCMQAFDAYLPAAKAGHEQAKQHSILDDGEDALALLFISSIPWLSYTALQQPTPFPADSNPRITWGKYTTHDGRTTLPVTLLVNHALADGRHIGDFYAALEAEMQAFCHLEP